MGAATTSPAVERCLIEAREAKAASTAASTRWRVLGVLALIVEIGSSAWVLLHLIGVVWSTLLVWSALLIGIHMVANAWGTRTGSRRLQPGEDGELPTSPRVIVFAPVTRLHHAGRMSWAPVLGVVFGAMLGGPLGMVLLWLAYRDTLDYGGLIIGGISAAAVGAFAGFLSSSFVDTSLRAFREASYRR